MDDGKKKPKNGRPKSQRVHGVGETWGYTCFKRYSLFFVGFALGSWTQQTCARLMAQVRKRVRTPNEFEHLVLFTDGNDDYQYVLPRFFDTALVDYAQYVKIRQKGKIVDYFRRVIFGEPFVLRANVGTIEGSNGILRERIACLVRRTKCIAKKLLRMENALHVFQFYWNFINVQKERKTPAELEGLTKHKWTWSEFLHYHIKLH